MRRTFNQCKICGADRDEKFQGNICRNCYNIYQKKKYYDRQILKPKKFIKQSPCRYPRDYSFNESMVWIERVIKNKGWVNVAGLNELITVYYSIGYTDSEFHISDSTQTQLEKMWKKCLVFHKSQKSVLESNI